MMTKLRKVAAILPLRKIRLLRWGASVRYSSTRSSSTPSSK